MKKYFMGASVVHSRMKLRCGLLAISLIMLAPNHSFAQVSNGQPVNASTTNGAYIFKNSNDTALNQISLGNTVTSSGSSITNIQREFNSLSSFTGKPINQVFNYTPAWTNTDVGTSTDSVKARADSITAKFNGTTGHAHTGAAGDGAPISYSSITGSPVLKDSTLSIVNSSDATKIFKFSLGGMTTGKTLTLSSSQTTTQSLALPSVGSGDSLVTNNTTATLALKTLTSPSLTTPTFDIFTGVQQSITPTSPSFGNQALYFRNDGHLYELDSTGTETQVDGGGGQGGLISDRELIPNTNLEANATGYAAYADAAGTQPVDGTGGSPNTTCARTTSSPITGVGSLLITKAGSANRQGEGCSISTNTLSTADKLPTVEQIDFDYKIASGTFTAGSDGPSGVNSDYEVYIYDIANSVVIQPLVFKLYSNVNGHFTSWFQSATNATTYRLIFHNATTTTNNFTLELDNISIHPAKAGGAAGQGAIWVGSVGSGQSVTANTTDITVTTVKDSSNAWNGSQYVVPFAGDYLFGGVVASSGSSVTSQIYKNGTALTSGSYFSTQAVSNGQGGGSILVPNCKAGDLLSIRSSVSGTISSAYLSIIMVNGGSGSSIPNPSVASIYSGNGGQSITGSTDITFSTLVKDTNSAWNGTQYKAQYPGFYHAVGVVNTTASATGTLQLFVNGSAYVYADTGGASNGIHHFSGTVYLKAGDTLAVRYDSASLTLNNNAVNHYIAITMVPPGIGASPAGTVSSNSYSLERIERARITGSATTPVIASQSGAWISSVSRTVAGKYVATIVTGMFSSAPTCTCRCKETSNGAESCEFTTDSTATSFETVCTKTSTEAGNDQDREVICMGPR